LSIRLALAAALCAVFLPGSAAAESPTLKGTVGPGFTITLQNADGSLVTHLDPGTYTIVVDDRATVHDFHLFGPGVNVATDVEQTGTVTWSVTFADGKYQFQCDPHADAMHGSFTVGNVPPTTTTTTPPPPPAGRKLAATVGPGFTISVRRGGARVASLAAGTYSLTVRDLSPVHDFHLVGPGVNRRTGIAATGTVTWRVRLKRGVYRFQCDPHRTVMRGTFRVR
jgi:plastocyanin